MSAVTLPLEALRKKKGFRKSKSLFLLLSFLLSALPLFSQRSSILLCALSPAIFIAGAKISLKDLKSLDLSELKTRLLRLKKLYLLSIFASFVPLLLSGFDGFENLNLLLLAYFWLNMSFVAFLEDLKFLLFSLAFLPALQAHYIYPFELGALNLILSLIAFRFFKNPIFHLAYSRVRGTI